MTDTSAHTLAEIVAKETARPLPEAVKQFASHLMTLAATSPLGAIFYGSNLRSGSLEGILDYYIVVERMADWQRGISNLPDTWLPPRVEYHEFDFHGQTLRAKISIIPASRFERLASFHSLDTTLWARFCQPVAIAWARDDEARQALGGLVAGAIATASRWAVLLGPATGKPLDYWQELFKKTYAVELRVEQGRAGHLLSGAERHFDTLLAPAWSKAGIGFAIAADGQLAPALSPAQRAQALRGWAWRRRFGKPLNILRLCKAAFSFSGGASYIAWKVERHSGIVIPLSQWQKRHPLLAAPRILWLLWRQGAFRQTGRP